MENDNSIIIACSVHLPAGHDWLEAIPRKVYLAKCVRCAIAELQVTFGADVPIFAMGDFNSRKKFKKRESFKRPKSTSTSRE